MNIIWEVLQQCSSVETFCHDGNVLYLVLFNMVATRGYGALEI